jgi:hypothetical protein
VSPINIAIDRVSGGAVDEGLDALADALLLLTADVEVDMALQVAREINASLFEKDIQRRALEAEMQRLRARLAELEQRHDST